MASRSRIQLEEWLKTIDVSGSVLDIGGSQNPIQGRTRSWEVSDYAILDLESPHQCARRPDIKYDIQKFSDDVEIAFASQAGERGMQRIRDFNTVFCIEVSEYWHDPASALKNIRLLTETGGTLYITFHWLYGIHKPAGTDMLRYSFPAIRRLLEDAGFSIEECTSRDLSPAGISSLRQFYRAEGMRINDSDPNAFTEGFLIKAKAI